MNNIKLLDCTLRDGGYVNNWEFGYDRIKNIIKFLEKSGAEILELGFMRDEQYKKDRAIYNSIAQVVDVIGEKKRGSNICYVNSDGKLFSTRKIGRAKFFRSGCN